MTRPILEPRPCPLPSDQALAEIRTNEDQATYPALAAYLEQLVKVCRANDALRGDS